MSDMTHVLIWAGSMPLSAGIACLLYSADRLALHDFGPEKTRDAAGETASRLLAWSALLIGVGLATLFVAFHLPVA